MMASVQLFLRFVCVLACWLAAWATPCLVAGDVTTPTAAGWTPAEIPGIGGVLDAATKEVKRSGNPSQIAAFADVRDVMTHASEWRWYSRDNGILLAIPIRERLGFAAKADGEKALADVVRRLINQAGWGNPPVQVVLVGQEELCPARRACRPAEISLPAAPCACN